MSNLDSLFAMLSSSTRIDNTLQPQSEFDLETSRVYNTNALKTALTPNTVIPVVYGKSLVAPVLINYFVESGEYDTLNMLYGIAEGEIHSVTDIKVGGKPIAELFSSIPQNAYNDCAEINISKGSKDQPVVNGFEDVHNVQAINDGEGQELLYNIPYIHEMTIGNAESFGITFLMDKCYSVDDSGVERSWYQSVKIEYRTEIEEDYTFVGIFQFTEQTQSTIKRRFQSDYFSPGKYFIKITKVSADQDSRNFGKLSLFEIDEITLRSFSYPSTATMAIRLITSESFRDITCVAYGMKIQAPNVVDANGEIVLWEDYYYDGVLRVFRKLATGQHLIWNGDYRHEWCGNNALCLKDLLLSKRYGLGRKINQNMINQESFVTGMLFCEEGVEGLNGKIEKRMRLDITLDALRSADQWINTICISMRGVLDYSHNNIRLVVEKAETPSFIFNNTSLIPKSFSIDYITEKSIPNVLSLQFPNKDKDYQISTYSLPDSAAIENGDILVEGQSQFIGVTRISQVLREGRILLNKYKTNTTPIKFKTYIHAFPCQIGDVFLFQNNELNGGEGGRILSTNGNILCLDKQVSIELGLNYSIAIKNIMTDEISIFTVKTTNAVTNEIEVNEAIIVPFNKYSEWYLYETGTETMYRIANISRGFTGIIDITAVNYDPAVYDFSDIPEPVEDYKYTTLEIPLATNVIVRESAVRLADGTIENSINVSWYAPAKNSRYLKVAQYFEIYISDNDGVSWLYIGQTDKSTFSISRPFSKNVKYSVAVITVTNENERSVPATSPVATVTIRGWEERPQTVTGFAYSFEDEIKLSWDKSLDSDIAGYEIRLQDENWGNNDPDFLVWRGQAEISTIIRPTARSGVTYYIKSFNRTGLYSSTASYLTPINMAPQAPSLVGNALFQKVFLMWNDSSDLDLMGYEVWQSNTINMIGEISGAESLRTKALGTSIVVGVDFNPTYFRIRGYDKFGPGDWSNIISVSQISLTGNDLGAGAITETQIADGAITTPKITAGAIVGAHISANTIVAEKLSVACLSAISANLGCINAGTLVGATIKTSDDVYRTELNRDGLQSYDVNGVKLIDLSSGQLKLYDAACCDYYSYLNSGALSFRTPYETIPYVKRIQSGIACAGETVTLCRWQQPPELNLGIKRLMAYSPDKAESCQEWCVYADGIRQYNCGGSDFGYKFDIHAKLSVSGGTRAEEVYLENFDVTKCTGTNTCEVLVKELFQLWCHEAAPAPICYGVLGYSVLYKIAGAPSWCCCDFTYTQPHGSETLMKTTNIACQTIHLGAGNVWEIQLHRNSLSWVNSGVISGGTTCCLCCYNYNVDCSYYAGCTLTQNGTISNNVSISHSCCLLYGHMCTGIEPPFKLFCVCQCLASYHVACNNYSQCNIGWGTWDLSAKPICYLSDVIQFSCLNFNMCVPTSCTALKYYGYATTYVVPFMDRATFCADACTTVCSHLYFCYNASVLNAGCGGGTCAISGCCNAPVSYSNNMVNVCKKTEYNITTAPNAWAAACCGKVTACLCMYGYTTFPALQKVCYLSSSRANLCLYGTGCYSANWTASRFICYKVCNICTCTCCYWYSVPCGSSGSCVYEKFYSTRDTTATECVLDPYGEINYLAIAYA